MKVKLKGFISPLAPWKIGSGGGAGATVIDYGDIVYQHSSASTLKQLGSSTTTTILHLDWSLEQGESHMSMTSTWR